MPNYEFYCNACKKTFAVQATIAEHEKTPPPTCIHCGSKNTTQLLSGITVITSKKS